MFDQYEKNILIDLIKKAIDEQKEQARQCFLANDELGGELRLDSCQKLHTILIKLNSNNIEV
jgi:hypothetical protein